MFNFFGDKTNDSKIPLDNLFVVTVGYVKNNTFCSNKECSIVKYRKDSNQHAIYEDIFTKQCYYLAFDYLLNNLEQCVAVPRTITSLLNDGPYKEKLLMDGYISKDELLTLYKIINPKKDQIDELIPTKPAKNKVKVKVKRHGNIIEFPNKNKIL